MPFTQVTSHLIIFYKLYLEYIYRSYTHTQRHFVALNTVKTTADFMDSTCEYIAMRHLKCIKNVTFQNYQYYPCKSL